MRLIDWCARATALRTQLSVQGITRTQLIERSTRPSGIQLVHVNIKSRAWQISSETMLYNIVTLIKHTFCSITPNYLIFSTFCLHRDTF